MKYKLYLKLIVIFIFFIIIIIPNYSRADLHSSLPVDPTKQPTYYKPEEEESSSLQNIGKTILTVINVVGVVVSVVTLGIIGLRYMFGSVEERAKYKETMLPYVVGLVMLGGITTIVNIIYNLASKI